MISARLPVPRPCAATSACRGPDQQAQHLLGHLRRYPEAHRGLPRLQQHVALAGEIPRRPPGLALHARDVLRQALALGNQFQQFSVDAGQSVTEIGEVHQDVPARGSCGLGVTR